MKTLLLVLCLFSAHCAHACDEDELEPETINFKVYKPCMNVPGSSNYCKKVKK